jgi:glutathione peroxidase-family protein
VFTYLKAQLPGSFGSFVKWNFTKFLVDRNGNPVKRFAPSDAPLSFEQEIVALLEQAPAAF